MPRPEWMLNCEAEVCENMPVCDTCGRRKKPLGRDSADNGLCGTDCPGYAQGAIPGHLWPGELARMDEEPT